VLHRPVELAGPFGQIIGYFLTFPSSTTFGRYPKMARAPNYPLFDKPTNSMKATISSIGHGGTAKT
jgi:hypothetical protein